MSKREYPEIDILAGFIDSLISFDEGDESIMFDVNLLLGVDDVLRMFVKFESQSQLRSAILRAARHPQLQARLHSCNITLFYCIINMSSVT